MTLIYFTAHVWAIVCNEDSLAMYCLVAHALRRPEPIKYNAFGDSSVTTKNFLAAHKCAIVRNESKILINSPCGTLSATTLNYHYNNALPQTFSTNYESEMTFNYQFTIEPSR